MIAALQLKGMAIVFSKSVNFILKSDVMSSEALLAQAAQFLRCGQHDKAEELYKQMLSMLPSQPEVSYNLAVLLRQSGRLCESLPYFKEALGKR